MGVDDPDLTDEEREALRELQHAVEHVYRGYGGLLEFHHEMGQAFDRLETAREQLRTAGRDDFADALRDDILPAGCVEDMWTYEVVEDVRSGIVDDVTEIEATIREELADGLEHLDERELQQEWRGRAEREDRRGRADQSDER